MSEAQEDPGQTAEEGDALPTGGSTSGAEQTDGDALRQRIMQDGEFAWEQVRKRDQYASQLQNQLKQLEPFQHLSKLAGGPDQVIQLAQLGGGIHQVPGLAELVQRSVQAGRLEVPESQEPSNRPDENDEWIDPDTRKVRDELSSQIHELKEQLGQLTQMANGANVRSQENRVRENIEKVMEQFKSVPEAYEEAQQMIEDRYRQAFEAAQRGNAQQAQMIDQLASPDGSGILEYLTMPILRKYGSKLFSASQTETAEGNGGVPRRSTDERTVNPSRPGASPMPPLPKGPVRPETVAQMFREAARRRGVTL